jgi:hypothetical protein
VTLVSRDVRARRIHHLRPYVADHDRSVVARADSARIQPSTLTGLVHWASREWAREVPLAMNGIGPWTSSEGGSLLGSPQDDPTFRRYIEERPDEAHLGELEGHRSKNDGLAYERPMHAALWRLHGPRWKEPYTAAAHRLFAFACMGFDLEALTGRTLQPSDGCQVILPIAPYDRDIWWKGALTLWWERCVDGPMV